MKRYSLFLLILTAGLWISGCSSDDGGPSGPQLTAPTDLITVTLSADAIRLAWTDNTSFELGYRVQRAPEGSDEFTQIAEFESDTEAFTDSDLHEGTTYRYRVLAYSQSRETEPSNVAEAKTWPKPPTGLTATRESGTEISLAWVDSSEVEDGFELQRQRRGEDEFSTIETFSANTTSATDTGLTPNVRYSYRVRATLGEEGSSWSEVARVTTTVYYPDAPSELEGIALGSNEVLLTWLDNSQLEEGFVVETSLDGTNWPPAEADSIKRSNARNFTKTELQAETVYFFRVYAHNDSGSSAMSNVVEVETDPGPPPAPSNLEVEALRYDTAEITWQDNSGDEVGFLLDRKDVPGTFWSRIDTLDANAVSYVDSTLRRARTYAYRVAAFSENGVSAWSEQATVTMPEGPPPAPSNLRVDARGLDEIRLVWNDNSGNEEGFYVERKGEGEQDFAIIDVTEEGVASYNDTGLESETWYHYRVKAFNRDYESGYSNVDSTQTWSMVAFYDDFEDYQPGEPPDNPVYRIVTAGDSWVRVSSNAAHQGELGLLFNDAVDDDVGVIQLLAEHRSVARGKFSVWLNLAANGHFGILGADANDLITYQIQFNDDNTYFARNGGGLINAGAEFPVNEWLHVVVEWDVSTQLYDIYFNDQLVNEALMLQRADHRACTQVVFVCFSNATITSVKLDEYTVEQIPEEEQNVRNRTERGNFGVEPVSKAVYTKSAR